MKERRSQSKLMRKRNRTSEPKVEIDIADVPNVSSPFIHTLLQKRVDIYGTASLSSESRERHAKGQAHTSGCEDLV